MKRLPRIHFPQSGSNVEKANHRFCNLSAPCSALNAYFSPNWQKAMSEKIVSLSDLSERSAQLRSAGKKLVVTNGCFDLLHVGHVRYLQAARALGDLLAVGLNSDHSVRELKGKGRPVTAERDRAEILAALECVDFVTIFPELRATQFIGASRPAIYVKGGDYKPETLNEEEHALLRKIGAEVRFIPFEPGYSTSGLLEKICKGEG
jgi:rfaE bifunctional protein nucleotidyltransferase chain/domain